MTRAESLKAMTSPKIEPYWNIEFMYENGNKIIVNCGSQEPDINEINSLINENTLFFIKINKTIISKNKLMKVSIEKITCMF